LARVLDTPRKVGYLLGGAIVASLNRGGKVNGGKQGGVNDFIYNRQSESSIKNQRHPFLNGVSEPGCIMRGGGTVPLNLEGRGEEQPMKDSTKKKKRGGGGRKLRFLVERNQPGTLGQYSVNVAHDRARAPSSFEEALGKGKEERGWSFTRKCRGAFGSLGKTRDSMGLVRPLMKIGRYLSKAK